MKEIVISDKEKYAHLYDIIGVVIFTGESSRIFFKAQSYNFEKTKNNERRGSVKKSQKKPKKKVIRNECFIFVNKSGKVITISKEFEKFFCLILPIIKRYKINVFRDILKIENTNNKSVIKKSLMQIYENIADLNFELMQNNTNEEFSKIYKNIKQLQGKILQKNGSINVVCQLEKKTVPKNEKDMKIFYYISFNIEIDNTSTSLSGFLGKEVPNQQISTMHLAFPQKRDSKLLSKRKIFEINTNRSEIYTKLKQIQLLSLKFLTSKYNLKSTEIFNLTKNEEQELNTLAKLDDKDLASPLTSTSSSLPSNTTAGLNTKSISANTNG